MLSPQRVYIGLSWDNVPKRARPRSFPWPCCASCQARSGNNIVRPFASARNPQRNLFVLPGDHVGLVDRFLLASCVIALAHFGRDVFSPAAPSCYGSDLPYPEGSLPQKAEGREGEAGGEIERARAIMLSALVSALRLLAQTSLAAKPRSLPFARGAQTRQAACRWR